MNPTVSQSQESAVSKAATVTIQSKHVITYSDPVVEPTVVIPGPEVTVKMGNDQTVRYVCIYINA